MFDLNLSKLLILAVLALVIFGPNELPRIARQAGRALRDLRRIAEGAKEDLREGLGPEFQDFDFADLNPRQFVRKHLFDDEMAETQRILADELRATSGAMAGGMTEAVGGGTAAAGGAPTAPPDDGADPSFDIEAT